MTARAVALRPVRSWRASLEGSWPALAAALLATSLARALFPSSWRRPVSDAFWQALGFATLGSLGTVLVAAIVVGLGVVAQALYWLNQVGGDLETVRGTLMQVLLRELAPLTVGVVMLGRSGLVHLTELSTMRDDGTVRVLEAEGIDPALLLAMPRILALGIATFCHALLFTLVTVGLGYAGGALLGLTVRPPVEFAFALVRDLGATGVLVLPLKTFLIGLVIGAVVSATALHPSPRGRALVLPHGFFRALIALALVSALVSVIL